MVDRILYFSRFMMREKRLEHVVRVRDFSLLLSRIHGLDPFKVEIMAVSHDLFRDVPKIKLLRMARVWGIEIDRVELSNPILLHGKIAAEFLKRRFGVEDESVLLAIAYHTSGHPEMDEYGKLMVVADTVSYDRDFPGVEELRELALCDLERAFKEVMRNRILHAVKTGRFLLPMSVETWNRLMGRDGVEEI